jgi:hypothetical protein
MALGQEVASQAVGDLAGINLVILLLGRGDRSEHQWMGNLHLFGVWKQMVIDPAGKDGSFHGNRAWLGQSSDPAVQFPARRSDLTLLLHAASRILYAKADRFLVYIKSDEVHSLTRNFLRNCTTVGTNVAGRSLHMGGVLGSQRAAWSAADIVPL